MPFVITTLARKGGVGKSTVALNLAGAALDDGSKRVCLIDFDSQATLSKALIGSQTVEALRPDETVQAVVEGYKKAADVVRETLVPGLFVVPSWPGLKVPIDGRLNLDGLDASLIVIDTPPAILDPAVRCALAETHAILSPLLPEAWSIQSVPGVQSLLLGAGIVTNPHLHFAGWLMNNVQRAAIHTACVDTMRRLHGPSVFDNAIPSAVAFKEAAAAGQPITHFSPKSAAAKVARAVFDELMARMEKELTRRNAA